jgi:menaquinone-specific isochorismate synthase
MSGDTASGFAFLQVDARTFLCASGPFEPLPPGARARGIDFLAPDFSLAPSSGWWWRPATPVSRLSREAWRARFPQDEMPASPLSWEPADEARFKAGFDSLRPLLAAGSLDKGVPVTRSRAPLPPEDAAPLFERLLARVPRAPDTLIAYGLFLPGARRNGPEFIIGATPELLFDAAGGGRVRTMAVAGTRRVEAGGDQALERSAKDRVEHQAVIDDVRLQVARWGCPQVGPVRVRRFGELYHLVSEIDLVPRTPARFEDLVRALHPTPALGVAPRGEAGTAWLDAIDPLGERGRFGAPFGVREQSGTGRVVVAIRGLQYRDGHVELWAGCGVVAASEYAAEWQEIQDKMQAVRKLWSV